MAFFPYEQLNIVSKIKPEVLSERISANVSQFKWSDLNPFKSPDKSYAGDVNGFTFEIR